MEDTTSSGRPVVDREKTAPFLIRTFVKVGTFHRLDQFEDGRIPIADEQQIYAWKDATLREVLTSLRIVGPNTPEYRHPLARYTFRALYADAANRGRFAQKELGQVYSRDILGEPGTLDSVAPRLTRDDDDIGDNSTESADEKSKEERTLDELRFVPGDYLCVMVVLPKNAAAPAGPASDAVAKAAPGGGPAANGWKGSGGGAGRGDSGWGGSLGSASAPGAGRGGGHWRGGSEPAPRGRGGRRGGPPRRESPPRRAGGWGDRRRSPSPRSRSRSPPRRRNTRYD
ncbi:hypothetical protein K474DRAFT_1670640 [Panus rudis PR-1116 ss-1]|nr:hypothetical protein K474DRAFT_1670640 [Panus rudis PR-1116 ss-1]